MWWRARHSLKRRAKNPQRQESTRANFVELAGHETVIVEFVLDGETAQRLRAEIAANGLNPIAAQWPVSVCVFKSDTSAST